MSEHKFNVGNAVEYQRCSLLSVNTPLTDSTTA
jgi:hypothetical protein